MHDAASFSHVHVHIRAINARKRNIRTSGVRGGLACNTTCQAKFHKYVVVRLEHTRSLPYPAKHCNLKSSLAYPFRHHDCPQSRTMDDTVREGVLEEWDPVKKVGAICANDQPDYLVEIDETSIAVRRLHTGLGVLFLLCDSS